MNEYVFIILNQYVLDSFDTDDSIGIFIKQEKNPK
jgi:hypothetical protein